MRVLLTSNASYEPPKGGSTRGNLAWMRGLVQRGHDVLIVCPTDANQESSDCEVDGIRIHRVRQLSFHIQALGQAIRGFDPDWVLVSSEDLSHVLLKEAASVAPERLVYLAHTPQWFPFGPESWNPDAKSSEVLARAQAVIAIGDHMAAYIEKSLGRPAHVIHPPVYGAAPYRKFGRFGSGSVLMINPCTAKGLPIFLGLAKAFPDVQFDALNGWGTTPDDRAALESLPNTRLLKNVPDIEEVLEQSRLLLMPSLWYEGFGLIAMEAMLRGLPVIASNSGGLEEAKRHTGYVIPVEPIRQWESRFDATHMPVAVVPPQNLDPWKAALHTLLTNEAEYWAEAERSRSTALDFVSKLDAADFARFLESLPIPPRTQAAAPAPPVSTGSTDDSRLAKLDAAKKALLLKRLRDKTNS